MSDKEFPFFGVNYLVELIPEIPHIFSDTREHHVERNTDTLFMTPWLEGLYDMCYTTKIQAFSFKTQC